MEFSACSTCSSCSACPTCSSYSLSPSVSNTGNCIFKLLNVYSDYLESSSSSLI